MSSPIPVEIVLDVACGWSYIGYTRFAKVASTFRAKGVDIDVRFRPFQLAPEASTAGEPLLQVLHAKFGPGVDAANAKAATIAAQDGLAFNFDRMVHSNTFQAHRLIYLAGRQGRAEAMVERLFFSHYTRGWNIGDPRILGEIAEEVGVVVSGSGAEGADQVRAELDAVRHSGVRGVPVFRFPDGTVLSGAQTEQRIRAALHPAEGVSHQR